MVSPHHPRLPFLFALDEQYSEDDVEAMKAFVAELGGSRSWLLGAPEYVNQSQMTEWDRPEDLPIRTVGGVIELYSAFPPWGDQLPRETDLAHLAEVKAIVDALKVFTAKRKLNVTLELDDTWVGQIVDGVADDMVTDDLIGEWERSILKD
jgi:hypothetical protein